MERVSLRQLLSLSLSLSLSVSLPLVFVLCVMGWHLRIIEFDNVSVMHAVVGCSG